MLRCARNDGVKPLTLITSPRLTALPSGTTRQEKSSGGTHDADAASRARLNSFAEPSPPASPPQCSSRRRAPSHAGDIPTFAVDASWPKPLPNNWILGQVGGITVDAQGHIWVIHRPRSLTDDEKGAALTPPRSKCCVSAPPVLEFDADGNLLRSWGGPGEGYEWVGREHGIEVDEKGFVWVGGNADNDNAILKFTLDGKFVMQIGKIAPSKGSNDTTQLGKPAETAIDKDANEIYVADGYGNRRVIVFDATTGAYKRHWGAYGNPPNDDKQPAYDPKAPAPQQFANPVHCVKLANDGLRLCLRSHQQPHPGVQERWNLR